MSQNKNTMTKCEKKQKYSDLKMGFAKKKKTCLTPQKYLFPGCSALGLLSNENLASRQLRVCQKTGLIISFKF